MNQEFEELKEKAKSGDPLAQFKVGKHLIEGKKVPKDTKEGCKWLEVSAKASNADAQVMLADQYARGEGVTRNYEVAISWYQKASKEKHPEALYKMGLFMILAKRNDDSVFQGEGYLRHSSTAGNVNAQYELGLIYLRGSKNFHLDTEEAVRWFKKSSSSGHLPSLNILGYIYANGSSDKKVKPDEEQAIKYWKEAADRGYTEAQYNLANLYLKKAHELWETSANNGFQKSKYMLNVIKSHDLKR